MLELATHSVPSRRIADVVGVSHTQVCRDLRAALDGALARRNMSAEKLIALQEEKLDFIERAMTPRARAGDAQAAMVLLRASESRRRLHGLDAAVASKLELTGKDGGPIAVAPAEKLSDLTDEQLAERFQRAADMLAKVRSSKPFPVIAVPEPEPPKEPSYIELYERELERRQKAGESA